VPCDAIWTSAIFSARDLAIALVAGEFDEVTPDCAQTLQRGIAGSKLQRLKGCSRLCALEDRDSTTASCAAS